MSQTCSTVCVVARHRAGHKGTSCLLPPVAEDSTPDLALPLSCSPPGSKVNPQDLLPITHLILHPPPPISEDNSPDLALPPCSPHAPGSEDNPPDLTQRTRQKNERDRKKESNDSPKIQDSGETSDISGLPSGLQRHNVLKFLITILIIMLLV